MPVSFLRDLRENDYVIDNSRSTFQYVIELREKLTESAKEAAGYCC